MTLALLTGRGSHYSARHGAAPAYISRSLRLVAAPSICVRGEECERSRQFPISYN